MAGVDETRASSLIAALYVQHGEPLRRFLTGVLRDPDLAAEAMQAAFAKAIEQIDSVQEESLKSWVFRVAFHEALALRRRAEAGERAKEGWVRQAAKESAPAEAALVRAESVERVRAALETLPAEQREVVRMRMFEDQTFAAIAQATGRPLGTVLSRMQAALKKLREALETP